MENMNPRLEKTLEFMIYGSLMVLALGLLTSTTLLSLSHILMAFPALYFLPRANYKEFPKSAWALLALTIVIILSVLVNQDIAVKGIKPIFKAKYFLFGFLSIAPLRWYFKNHYSEKKISWLLYAFCIATTIATLSGLCGTFFGYNPLLLKAVKIGVRNGGLFGMLMNYAHNMSYFLIFVLGLIIYKSKIKTLVNLNFIWFTLIINLLGLYFSYTRGAWIGFLAGIPFFYFKNHIKIFLKINLGLLLFGGMIFFVAGDKIVRPESETERISQWKAAVWAFKERPILGYGYLNFEEHSSQIKKKYDLEKPNFRGHAHSNLFEMLGSTGILGFGAFILWIICWFVESYKSEDIFSKISLPFLIVFFVGGLTQSTISLGINLFFIMAVYSIGKINFKKDY